MSLIVAVVIAAILASCGGGGDDSTLSKAQFVKQANAICQRERGDVMTGLSAYYNKHRRSDESEAERFADALRAVYLPAVETELAKIRALDAPEGDEDQINAILVAEQKAVDAVSKQDRVPEGRFKVEEYFAAAAKLARAYGIPACANSNPRP